MFSKLKRPRQPTDLFHCFRRLSRPFGPWRACLLVLMAPIIHLEMHGMNIGAEGTHPKEETGPRKVVVGSALFSIFEEWPGLETRLQTLGALVDEMAVQAHKDFDRGLDLALLPEYAVTGGGVAKDVAVPLTGPVEEFFSALASKHSTYLVVPMILAEDRDADLYSNAAILFDRQGKVAGIYRKMFPVAVPGDGDLEGGLTPGRVAPVFNTDFGRIGVQICWDINYDEGWKALAEGGAEIVLWPTASPQTLLPSARASAMNAYLLSSTPRDNATLFDPLGMVFSQVALSPGEEGPLLLVEEIDLSYLVMGWQPALRDGAALVDEFGDKVGFRYSSREDRGLFWSNDPAKSIEEMVRALGLETMPNQIQRSRAMGAEILNTTEK